VNPRVLFLSHVGEIGGAELCLIDYLEHSRRAAHGSKVLLFADGPLRGRLERPTTPVEVLRAPGRVLATRRQSGVASVAAGVPGAFGLAARIAREAREHTLIYANSQKAFVIGALASAMARRPLIWHLHDILTSEHFGRAQRTTATGLANLRARRVIANSQATAAAFVAAGGARGAVEVIYNGIDPAAFDAIEPATARAALCRELNCGADALLVGSFSRLAAWKGQDILLQAVAQVPEAHAVLVGGALFGEEVFARELKDRATALGIAGRVHFIGFRHDVATLMRGVDAVAHCSREPEPFGRVIVEGMLAQKPVVATAAGGALEILEHERTGLLVSPGDAASLAVALARVTRDRAGAQAMAQRARAEALQRFSLRNFVAGIDAAIEAVADVQAEAA